MKITGKKQETKDGSAYSLNLVSEFSCKVHCTADILLPNTNQKTCVLQNSGTLQVLRYTFSLFTLGCHSLFPRTFRKKETQGTKALFSCSHPSWSPICHLHGHLPVLFTLLTFFGMANVSAYLNTKGLILSSFQIVFALHLLFQLLLVISWAVAASKKPLFTVWVGGLDNWEFLIKCNMFFPWILHGALILIAS